MLNTGKMKYIPARMIATKISKASIGRENTLGDGAAQAASGQAVLHWHDVVAAVDFSLTGASDRFGLDHVAELRRCPLDSCEPEPGPGLVGAVILPGSAATAGTPA